MANTKILVVDDELDSVTFIETILKKEVNSKTIFETQKEKLKGLTLLIIMGFLEGDNSL